MRNFLIDLCNKLKNILQSKIFDSFITVTMLVLLWFLDTTVINKSIEPFYRFAIIIFLLSLAYILILGISKFLEFLLAKEFPYSIIDRHLYFQYEDDSNNPYIIFRAKIKARANKENVNKFNIKGLWSEKEYEKIYIYPEFSTITFEYKNNDANEYFLKFNDEDIPQKGEDFNVVLHSILKCELKNEIF